MNRPATIEPCATISTVAVEPCAICEGSGYFYEPVRVAGEAYDADLQEVECEECDGTGFVECEAAE